MGPLGSVQADRTTPSPRLRTLGIVGLGLIGGSIAAAALRRWPDLHVIGVDRPDVVAEASRRGWIHDAAPSVAALSGLDLLVLATPVPQIIETINELGRAGIDVPVTDVGSTKRAIVEAADQAGLKSFVGGHPMAGAETSGIAGARADLFEERPWLIVPDVTRSDVALTWVEALVAGVGAQARRVDAGTHDRTVAFVSHLPQLVAVALMNAAGESVGRDGLGCAGRALVEMTRLASSPIEMWQGILETNADLVSEAIDVLRAQLDALDTRRDANAPQAAFAEAAGFRDLLQKVMP